MDPVLKVVVEVGASVPEYATDGAAGLDIRANVDVALKPMERLLVQTGLRIAVPEGFEAQIRPRSGLANKHGVTVLNSPGTIDSDYRGEIGVILINLGTDVFEIRKGDRIAQMVIAPVARVAITLCDELPKTGRGEGGFGSTGVR